MEVQQKTLKAAAMDFLQLASSGEVSKAYEFYAAKNFRHHNPYYKSDRQSLMQGMEENSKTNPNKEFTMLHTLEDGHFVAVHSRVVQESQSQPISVVHLFRFEGGMIEELWDVIMVQPKDMVNEVGMF